MPVKSALVLLILALSALAPAAWAQPAGCGPWGNVSHGGVLRPCPAPGSGQPIPPSQPNSGTNGR